MAIFSPAAGPGHGIHLGALARIGWGERLITCLGPYSSVVGIRAELLIYA